MLHIELLKNHPECIPELAKIWHQVLGSIWVPDIPIERVEQNLQNHLNENTLPLTYVAFIDNQPVGMCSLRITDGILPDLSPWLGSLVVDPRHQKKGIAKQLVDTIMDKAKQFRHKKLYLFAFDLTIPQYYSRLGWRKIGMDEFKGRPVTVMEIIL